MRIRFEQRDPVSGDAAQATTPEFGYSVPSTRPPVHLKRFYFFSITNVTFMQCTLGGTLFGLYMAELGLNPARIGMLVALFPFMQILSLGGGLLAERMGFRRAFLLFFGSRKIAVMALAAAPWVVSWGSELASFLYVATFVSLFGILRSLGETALFPWQKEFIPDLFRGRVLGTASMSAAAASIIGMVIVAFIVESGQRTDWGHFLPYQMAFLFFPLLALSGVIGTRHLPGGEKSTERKTSSAFYQGLFHSLRDRKFRLFLTADGMIMGCSFLFLGLMPVYMKSVIGIPSSKIVLLGAMLMAGGILGGFYVGRVTEGLQSRKLIVRLLIGMSCLPVLWMLLPELGRWRIPGAFFVYFCSGFVGTSLAICVVRLLFNEILPERGKTEYLSVRYAFCGLVAGMFPLIGGKSTSWFSEINGTFAGIQFTPFLPAFFACSMAWILCAFVFLQINTDDSAS